MKTTSLLLAGFTLTAIIKKTDSATTAPVIASYYGLELGGASVGTLRAMDGGDIFADVLKIRFGETQIEQKSVRGPKYGDFTVQVSGGLSKPFYDWISDTVDQLHPQQDGAIVVADSRFQAIQRGAFIKAL